jgi:hypothetical protein
MQAVRLFTRPVSPLMRNINAASAETTEHVLIYSRAAAADYLPPEQLEQLIER